ncbi:MAG: hypothetical protein IPJ34_07245 [Myxococcales bacterium]|nr:hypothetical protein [Myxococcales bacterium]
MPAWRRGVAGLVEFGAAGALWTLVHRLSLRHQPAISVHGGRGWDGQTYYEIAAQLADHGTAAGASPFASRLGTGLLADLVVKVTGRPLDRAFFLVNVTAGLLLCFALVALLRRHVPRAPLRLVAVALFVSHWAGPVRLAHHQLFVEPLAELCVTTGLVVIDRVRARLRSPGVLLFGGVCFAAALVREITLVLPLAFVVSVASARVSAARRVVAATIPLLSWALGAITVRRLVEIVPGVYDPRLEALRWLYEKSLPVALHGLLLSFGLVPALLMAYREEVVEAARALPHLAFSTVAFVGLALLGGDSTERLLTYATIPLLALTGSALARDPRALIGFPAVATLVVAAFVGRIFWPIPDYPTLGAETPDVVIVPVGKVAYDDLWSTLLPRVHRVEQLASLAQLSALGAFTYAFCRRRRGVA